MFDLILLHIIEIAPFYLIFEMITFYLKKYFDFNTIYFLLHFIVNLINTIILLPIIFKMRMDPLLEYYNYNSSCSYIYPILIGLHTLHLRNNLNEIYYDEVIHHIITHIFWYIFYLNKSPLYIVPMIGMSGIPGGITYLILFMQKFGRITKLTEKYISMNLNIWLRAPICIISSALLYVKNVKEYEFGLKDNFNYYLTLFMIFFTFINGVHFMNNIINSYYENYYKNYYKKNKII